MAHQKPEEPLFGPTSVATSQITTPFDDHHFTPLPTNPFQTPQLIPLEQGGVVSTPFRPIEVREGEDPNEVIRQILGDAAPPIAQPQPAEHPLVRDARRKAFDAASRDRQQIAGFDSGIEAARVSEEEARRQLDLLPSGRALRLMRARIDLNRNKLIEEERQLDPQDPRRRSFGFRRKQRERQELIETARTVATVDQFEEQRLAANRTRRRLAEERARHLQKPAPPSVADVIASAEAEAESRIQKQRAADSKDLRTAAKARIEARDSQALDVNRFYGIESKDADLGASAAETMIQAGQALLDVFPEDIDIARHAGPKMKLSDDGEGVLARDAGGNVRVDKKGNAIVIRFDDPSFIETVNVGVHAEKAIDAIAAQVSFKDVQELRAKMVEEGSVTKENLDAIPDSALIREKARDEYVQRIRAALIERDAVKAKERELTREQLVGQREVPESVRAADTALSESVQSARSAKAELDESQKDLDVASRTLERSRRGIKPGQKVRREGSKFRRIERLARVATENRRDAKARVDDAIQAVSERQNELVAAINASVVEVQGLLSGARDVYVSGEKTKRAKRPDDLSAAITVDEGPVEIPEDASPEQVEQMLLAQEAGADAPVVNFEELIRRHELLGLLKNKVVDFTPDI